MTDEYETEELRAEVELLEWRLERLEGELEATRAELERWRHGEQVEGDYVCENALELQDLRAAHVKLLHACECGADARDGRKPWEWDD